MFTSVCALAAAEPAENRPDHPEPAGPLGFPAPDEPQANEPAAPA